MTKSNLYPTLKKIISNIFNVNKSNITLQTTSDDIEEWDSLGHIRLILKLESELNVKFNSKVIPKLTSVESILSEINKAYSKEIKSE